MCLTSAIPIPMYKFILQHSGDVVIELLMINIVVVDAMCFAYTGLTGCVAKHQAE